MTQVPSMSGPSLDDLLQSTAEVLFPDEAGAVVTLASRASDGDSPLHVLLWRKDVEGVRMLVDAGADVDAAGDLDETPLHVAVRHGLADAVACLLQAGADPDVPCVFGDTARERAQRHGGDCAALLRDAPPGQG